MTSGGAEAHLHLESGIEAWEYKLSTQNQRLSHKHIPNRPVPLAHLHELGVSTGKVIVEDDVALEQIRTERGYIHSECITVSRESMEDFDARVEAFFKEHMHSQEEVRVILDGSGYWDIRDYDDKWIRFSVSKGDMIILPAGMLHRFTLDERNYVKALLLYSEVPKRTQHNPEEHSVARQAYVKNFFSKFLSDDRIEKQQEAPPDRPHHCN